jgi:hypothetical protein
MDLFSPRRSSLHRALLSLKGFLQGAILFLALFSPQRRLLGGLLFSEPFSTQQSSKSMVCVLILCVFLCLGAIIILWRQSCKRQCRKFVSLLKLGLKGNYPKLNKTCQNRSWTNRTSFEDSDVWKLCCSTLSKRSGE